MRIYRSLTTTFKSRTGRWYLYEALGNRIFLLPQFPEQAAKEFEIVAGSPIEELEWPFTEQQLIEATRHGLTHLVLNVTDVCNLRCVYCSYSGEHRFRRSHNAKFMSDNVARSAVDWFFAHASKTSDVTVSFYGGEPLTRPFMIEKTIDYARKVRGDMVRFQIVTNATLIDYTFAAWFAHQSDIWLKVTLNGPAEIHDQLRVTADGSATHRRVLKGLTKLRHAGEQSYRQRVGFLCNFASYSDIQRQMEWFARSQETLGKWPQQLQKIALADASDCVKDRMKIVTEQEDQAARASLQQLYIDALQDRNTFHYTQLLWDHCMRVIHYRLMQTLRRRATLSGSCMPSVLVSFVDVSGGLRLCEKADGKVLLGDITQGLDYPKLSKLLQCTLQLLKKRCPHCWALRLCRLCLNDFIDDRGPDREQIARRCSRMRHQLLGDLGLYCSILEVKPGLLDYLAPQKLTR